MPPRKTLPETPALCPGTSNTNPLPLNHLDTYNLRNLSHKHVARQKNFMLPSVLIRDTMDFMVATQKFSIFGPDEANTEAAIRQQAAELRLTVVSCEPYYDGSWLVSYSGAEADVRQLLRDIFKVDYRDDYWYLENGQLKVRPDAPVVA